MPSTTRHRHRMRCGVEKCRHRFALSKHPVEYVRAVKRPACGDHLHVRSIEAERQRELAKQDRCLCSSYPFPHRKGSLRFCDYHPLKAVEPTAQEWEEYEGCMSTPRSSGNG